MRARITTKFGSTITIGNIREMSHTKDGMLILLPNSGTVPISLDGTILMYSEMPSFDTRTIRKLDIDF